MNDKTKPRYEYDADEEFFVDNSKPDEDGMGEELLTEEVVTLLNAGEAMHAQVEALRAVGLQASYVAGWVRPELVPQHEWDFLMSLVAILRHEDFYATVVRTHEEAKAIVARKATLAAGEVKP